MIKMSSIDSNDDDLEVLSGCDNYIENWKVIKLFVVITLCNLFFIFFDDVSIYGLHCLNFYWLN